MSKDAAYEPKLLGWTFDQWAIVIGQFPPESFTYPGLIESRRQWLKTRRYEPGSEVLTPKPLKDWAAVEKMLDLEWR